MLETSSIYPAGRLAQQRYNKFAIAAVVDRTSRLVPATSALDPLHKATVFEYRPEGGVAVQHVGPLVGRRAHREIWPKLVRWMQSAED